MKWFQQNRALGMLLVGFIICALLVGALFYWRWSVWADARQTFDQVAAERNRLQQLDPFPNDANYRKLQDYLKSYTAALDKFKEQLKGEVAAAPPLAPNEFQSRLRLVVIATLDRARANNVKLPDRFELGFDEFARTMPDTAVTRLLGQELSQIQKLINIVLDAKVDSVTSFRRAPLTEEHGASPTPTPSPAPGQMVATAKPGSTPAPTLIQRNIVDVSFKAAPGVARKVLNENEVFQVVGCAIEVLNTLGHGLVEKPYENALVVEFGLRKIPFRQQPSFDVVYKAQTVGVFIPDLIAFDAAVCGHKSH